jgi:hypothetical protein
VLVGLHHYDRFHVLSFGSSFRCLTLVDFALHVSMKYSKSLYAYPIYRRGPFERVLRPLAQTA